MEVLKRDNYTCQFCGRFQTKYLEIDHIKPLDSRPDLALDMTNLRALCHECHNERHERASKWACDECFEW